MTDDKDRLEGVRAEFQEIDDDRFCVSFKLTDKNGTFTLFDADHIYGDEFAKELARRWNGFSELQAENAALKARVQELETPDGYFDKRGNAVGFLHDALDLYDPMQIKSVEALSAIGKRYVFRDLNGFYHKFKTREEAEAALEAMKNE
jgi:hypothetical protein